MPTTRDRRANYQAAGYREVTPTPDEIETFKRKNRGNSPRVYRVECERDGVRFWYSGLGRGAHERSQRHQDARKAR